MKLHFKRFNFLIFSLLTASAFLFSCASRPVQTEKITADLSFQNRQHSTPEVPFIDQKAGHCGPATLTMVYSYYGDSVTVDDVVASVYTPGMKGSLQSDMISAARRRGYMVVPIEGFNSLITEISNDHPVIVFENLALTWLPQWHYAVVYGYDLNKQIVKMHSGPEKDKHWDMGVFERSWMLGQYWGLVVLKPGMIANSASEFENSSAASSLESLGFLKEAEASYQAILKKWPESLVSLMGLGNIEFSKGNKKLALDYFKKATAVSPQNASAWHNRAILEYQLNLKKQAKLSAQEALKHATAEEKAKFEPALKQI